MIKVSIIITCFNEADNIIPCLDSLVKQRLAEDDYEIIVSDGMSTDGTGQKVREYAKDFSNISLVIEPGKGTALGRNAGIRASKYDYVAFIDADCQAPDDWLHKLISAYQMLKAKDKKLVAVGGKNITLSEASRFVKAIEIALDSYPGSFASVQGRQFDKPVYVNSLATLNVLYEKVEILQVGGFDESLLSEGEDAELNYRLSSKGLTFCFLPDSFVWHKMRATPAGWLKNMFRYGKARARLLKRYPKMWALSFLLPLLFLFCFVLTVFIPVSKVFYVPLIYFPFLLMFSAFQSFYKRKPALCLHVVLVYLIQHFGYAAGEFYGLLNPRVK